LCHNAYDADPATEEQIVRWNGTQFVARDEQFTLQPIAKCKRVIRNAVEAVTAHVLGPRLDSLGVRPKQNHGKRQPYTRTTPAV
jgi:hypothetical protein